MNNKVRKLYSQSLWQWSFGILMVSSLAVSGAFAQSVAKKGHECAYDVMVPNITCENPSAGDDIRLLITEYQSCKKGNVIDLSRSSLGMLNISSPDGTETHQMMSEDEGTLSVKFSSFRTHFDDWASDQSMFLPESALIKSGDLTYQLTITRKRALDYADAPADNWHYKGSFLKLDANGKVIGKGRLICMIIHSS